MQHSDHKSTLRNLSALVDFSNLINSSLELEFILSNLLLTCFGKFHTSKGVICLGDKSGSLIIQSHKGLVIDKEKKLFPIKIQNYKSDNGFKNFLEKNNLILVQEIVSGNDLLGLILLGDRLTGDVYTGDDKEFLQTFLNISATAIQNSNNVSELVEVNKNLDTKVHQLSALFDLSKEFSSILEIPHVCKLLGFSIIGQLLVTKYAVVVNNENGVQILESKFNTDSLESALSNTDFQSIKSPINCCKSENENCEKIKNAGVELIVPMKIKGKTKGLILLGRRTIGDGFSKSDIEFISSIGSLAIISIENSLLFKEALEKQRLEKDLELAKKIQHNLLPSKLPEMKNFEIAAYNQAAKQVGGDYYDAIRLDEERVLVCIGDVSGKGVQAALLMANLQAFLQSISKQDNDLISASNLLNDLVTENTSDGRFITFFWGILNDKTRVFESVNMGHNPPLLIRNGEIKKLKLGGMLMGVLPSLTPYKNEHIKLEPGDTLIMFTDGITEAMDEDNTEYSDEKLEELARTMSTDSAEEVLQKILSEVREFTQGREQTDDITALIVNVN